MSRSRARSTVVVTISCLLSFSGLASAGLILQDVSTGIHQIDHFEPIGQTFTAIDTHVLVGLYYEPINPHVANDDPIELRLYEGEGVGGALLAASTFSLPTGFAGYHDVSFASVPLTIGNRYTAVASIVGDSPYWGLRTASDLYLGGQLLLFGEPVNADSRFRVIGTTVPAPSTLLLMGPGVAVFVWRRRTH